MEVPERIERSIIQTVAHHTVWSYVYMRAITKKEYSTGTGFCIKIDDIPDDYLNEKNKGKFILTNEHCVHHIKEINIKKKGGSANYKMRIITAIMEFDLALIALDYEYYKKNKNEEELTKFANAFWDDIPDLKLGRIPEKTEKVYVYGYPLGGLNISVTTGSVNRFHILGISNIETIGIIALQIDAPINFGNSGGPVLNRKKEVVGVAFSGEDDRFTQNMGYVIPIFIVKHFIDIVKSKIQFTNPTGLGIRFQDLNDYDLRSYYKLEEDDRGILIVDVKKFQSSENLLKVYDILCSIDGIQLDNDGTIALIDMLGSQYELRTYGDELVNFETYISLKKPGEVVELSIIREGKKMKIKISLKADIFLVPILDKDLPYFIVAEDLEFVELTLMYILEREKEGKMLSITHLYDYLISQPMTHPDERIIVLINLSDPTHPTELSQSPVLDTFNDIKIINGPHFVQELEKQAKQKNFFKFTFRNTPYIYVLDFRNQQQEVIAEEL